jgi:hypothetical protein
MPTRYQTDQPLNHPNSGLKRSPGTIKSGRHKHHRSLNIKTDQKGQNSNQKDQI